MIAISKPPSREKSQTMCFPSTLYLHLILDSLLAKIPEKWRPELRLGLQEALVNAAFHGNKLDPTKNVFVAFSMTEEEYSWTIVNEGSGFISQLDRNHTPEEAECGRGLCIINDIFDRVQWNSLGTEVRLYKQMKGEPLIS